MQCSYENHVETPRKEKEVKEKEELKNLLKWGKFYFYIMVD